MAQQFNKTNASTWTAVTLRQALQSSSEVRQSTIIALLGCTPHELALKTEWVFGLIQQHLGRRFTALTARNASLRWDDRWHTEIELLKNAISNDDARRCEPKWKVEGGVRPTWWYDELWPALPNETHQSDVRDIRWCLARYTYGIYKADIESLYGNKGEADDAPLARKRRSSTTTNDTSDSGETSGTYSHTRESEPRSKRAKMANSRPLGPELAKPGKEVVTIYVLAFRPDAEGTCSYTFDNFAHDEPDLADTESSVQRLDFNKVWKETARDLLKCDTGFLVPVNDVSLEFKTNAEKTRQLTSLINNAWNAMIPNKCNAAINIVAVAELVHLEIIPRWMRMPSLFPSTVSRRVTNMQIEDRAPWLMDVDVGVESDSGADSPAVVSRRKKTVPTRGRRRPARTPTPTPTHVSTPAPAAQPPREEQEESAAAPMPIQVPKPSAATSTEGQDPSAANPNPEQKASSEGHAAVPNKTAPKLSEEEREALLQQRSEEKERRRAEYYKKAAFLGNATGGSTAASSELVATAFGMVDPKTPCPWFKRAAANAATLTAPPVDPRPTLNPPQVTMEYLRTYSELPGMMKACDLKQTASPAEEGDPKQTASPAEEGDDEYVDKDLVERTKMIEKTMRHAQLHPPFRATFGRFLGVPSDSFDPADTVSFPGWNHQKPLFVWQAYCACWCLRQLALGEDMALVELAVGLGKTVVGLAVLRMQQLFQHFYGPSHQHLYGMALPDDPTWTDPNPGDLYNLTFLCGGKKPKVRRGVTLLSSPKEMWRVWANAINDFIDQSAQGLPRLWMCLATSKDFTAEAAKNVPDGMFVYTRKLPFGHRCLPPKAVLEKFWGIKFVRESQKENEITLSDLLERDVNGKFHEQDAGGALPFHADWIVLVTPTSVEKCLSTGSHQIRVEPYTVGEDIAQNQSDMCEAVSATAKWECCLDLAIALALVDEPHMNKSPTVAFWQMMASLQGNPAFLFLDATPWTQPKEMSCYALAPQARYFDCVSGLKTSTKNGRPVYRAVWQSFMSLDHWKVGEIGGNDAGSSSSTTCSFKDAVDEADWGPIQERMWSSIKPDAQVAARWMNDNNFQKANDSSQEREFTGAAETALKALGNFWQNRVIKWESDFRWGFKGDPNPPIPAAAKPPHYAFLGSFDFEEDAAQWLRQKWNDLKTKLLEGKIGFTQIIHIADVYTALPYLGLWAEADPDLTEELDTLNLDIARKLASDPEQTHLWEYMPRFHATRLVQTVLHMVTTHHQRLNAHNEGSKLIITAFKPAIMSVFQMWVRWYAEQPGCPWSISDVAFIDTWSDKKAQAKQREDTNAFGASVDDEYQQSPWLLLANAGSIPMGYSLGAANAMILLDGIWTKDAVTQLAGRISRVKKVQRNAFTELFVLWGKAEGVHWLRWKYSKGIDQARVREELSAGREVELEAQE